MAIHTESSLSFILDEVVSAVAYNEFEQEPAFMPAIYGMRPGSIGRRERFASIGGLGQFQAKTEAADSAQANVTQQFEKTFTHTPYALHAEVSRELIDDNEFGFFQQLGEEMGMAAARKMESLAGGVFNDAFAGATYLGEDGLSLCNSAHVNVDSGNSQSNTNTLSFSGANLKTSRDNMRNFTDYEGEVINVLPSAIVCPTDLEQDVWEVLRSTLKAGGTNNDANFFNGMFSMYAWPYLTDANNWFVIDEKLAKKKLLWIQRTSLEIYGDGDLKKGTRTIGGYFRSSHGFTDWRWVYGNNAA